MHISQKQGSPEARISFNTVSEPANLHRASHQSLFLRWAVTVSNHAWLVAVIGSLVALMTVVLSVMTILDNRQLAIAHARQIAGNLTTIVRSDIARNLELYGLSVLAVVDGAEDPEIQHFPDGLQRKILFDRAVTAQYLGGAYLLDRQGRIKRESVLSQRSSLSLADRDYFQIHLKQKHAGLFFSKPFRSRIRDGKMSVGISRRVDTSDGEFDGIALLTINIDYFANLLDRIDVGESGVAAIIDNDGTLIARKPFREMDVAKDLSGSPVFKQIRDKSDGFFEETSTLDGKRRFFNFSRIPGTPWVVIIAPSEDNALADWRKQSRLTGLLTAIFALAFISLSWFLTFAVRDRANAYKALLAVANNDVLTGLKNRRMLDSTLDKEWRRAAREDTPVSLLFIDIGYFKIYNDTYGHSSGDIALRSVADCIAGSLNRPGDMAGRYGGEEFLVLLPNTEHEGTMKIAERIRASVEAMGMRHSGSSYGAVTISIGCATRYPSGGSMPQELIDDADKALYVAKSMGRNRSRSNMPPVRYVLPLK